MKRIISFMLVLTLMLSMVPNVFAQASNTGVANYADANANDFTYWIKNDTAMITGYRGAGGDVTIPTVIDGYPVTEISSEAFYRCDSLTSVTIPGSIATIGDYAFAECFNLISATIGEGITQISASMFSLCYRMETVTLPSSLTTISYAAFWDCDGLKDVYFGGSEAQWNCLDVGGSNWELFYATMHFAKGPAPSGPEHFTYTADNGSATVTGYTGEGGEITIPSVIDGNTVTAIGAEAFYMDKYITSVIVPDGVTTIGNSAFSNCERLVCVTLPDSVTNIEPWAFYNNKKLETVILSNGITAIKQETFDDCISLKSIVIPDGVTIIEESAFNGCTALETVTFGNGLLTIGEEAFYNCESLTSLELPDGVTTLERKAFCGCDNLESITIGMGLSLIGEQVFTYNYNLQRFTVSEENAFFSSDQDGILYNKDKTTLVQVPRKLSGSFTVPAGVTTIANYAFAENTGLREITIPDWVTLLGEGAFSDTRIEFIEIGAGITEIPDYAFESCSHLEEVKLPDGLKKLGNSCFYSVSDLVEINLPDGVESISDYAFRYCYDLREIVIPASVSAIGDNAFGGCNSLQTVYYTGSQEQWEKISVDAGNDIFEVANIRFNFDGNKEPVVPDDPNFIYITKNGTAYVSGYIGDVVDLVIPETLGGYRVVGISSRAFKDEISLRSVTIPDCVEIIEEAAFQGCLYLTDVSMGSGVTTIEEGAFSDCASLTSFTMGSGVTTIGASVFRNCRRLNNITLNDGLLAIGADAFSGCDSLTSVYLPDSVQEVKTGAFGYCDHLTYLRVPVSLTNFPYAVFTSTEHITDVYYAGTQEQWKTIRFNFENDSVQEANIHYEFTGAMPEAPVVPEFEYVVQNGKATITDYLGAGGEIIIPETLDGYPVTAIGEYAFEYNNLLISVVVPGGVEMLCDGAFFACDYLEVVILEGATSIGSSALGACDRLSCVVLNGNLVSMSDNAFSYSGLTEIDIPESVSIINEYTFSNCTNLGAITLSQNITNIYDGAFYECTNLADVYYTGTQEQWNAIVIGKNNECLINANIHYNYQPDADDFEYAVENDEATITGYSGTGGDITIPSALGGYPVVALQEYLFLGNISLTSVVIPDSVTVLGTGAFENCENLVSVTLPSGLNVIPEDAFRSCGKLTAIDLPATLRQIDARAFQFTGLESVTIPATVTTIGNLAFADLQNLTGVVVAAENANYCSDTKGVLFNKAKTELIQAPSKLTGTYEIPATVTTIDKGAFEDCDGMTAVTIPNSVTTIDRDAFNSCDSLTAIAIPDGVTSIGYKSFSNMKNLSTLTIGSGLTAIPEAAFYAMGQVTSVTIPEGVQTIGPAAFAGSVALEEVILPVSLKKIDAYGFGVPALKNVRYAGTQTQWNAIEITEFNDELLSATVHYNFVAHTHSYTKKVTKPTCTAKGYTTYTCECGDSYQDNETKVLGHSYKSGSCTRCKYKPVGAKITTQPVNVAVASGKTAKVTVKATGDGLKYQWYYAKKGAKTYTKASITNSFSVKMSSSYDGTKVYCVVSDSYGNSIKSSVVTLYKGTPAKITTQPKSITVANGKTGKLELKASGSSLKYTWYIKYKGASTYTKVGSSSKSYSFKMAAKLNGVQVYCVVKDKYGISVKSSVVTIKQAPIPKVTTQPKSVTQVSGKTASFSVKASGEGLKYQWYYAKKGSSSFKKLSGATKATYSVKVSSSVSGRKYYCLVTDKYGQTVKSSAVTLTMKTVAKITTQPKSVTVKNGSTAKVTIKAVGDGLKYTWYYLKPGATKYAKSSITSATFSVKMAAAWKNAKVYCVIADKYGNTVKSSVVTLKMK